jgi:hypothetical protein
MIILIVPIQYGSTHRQKSDFSSFGNEVLLMVGGGIQTKTLAGFIDGQVRIKGPVVSDTERDEVASPVVCFLRGKVAQVVFCVRKLGYYEYD